jgi:hypothetical protein
VEPEVPQAWGAQGTRSSVASAVLVVREVLAALADAVARRSAQAASHCTAVVMEAMAEQAERVRTVPSAATAPWALMAVSEASGEMDTAVLCS